MTDFHGTYTWHYIDNKDNIVGPVENHQYLICVENAGSPEGEWRLVMAYWYEEDCELTLRELDGTPHVHNIKKTGFYIVNFTGSDRYEKIYYVNNVRFWTEIKLPNVNPNDILTIV